MKVLKVLVLSFFDSNSRTATFSQEVWLLSLLLDKKDVFMNFLNRISWPWQQNLVSAIFFSLFFTVFFFFFEKKVYLTKYFRHTITAIKYCNRYKLSVLWQNYIKCFDYIDLAKRQQKNKQRNKQIRLGESKIVLKYLPCQINQQNSKASKTKCNSWKALQLRRI